MKFDKNKIKKLISNSLFLDQERRKKLLKLLEKSNEQECEGLAKTLEKEKPFFSDLIRNFLKTGGQPALDYLNSGFSQISKLSNKAFEKHGRSGEEEKCEKMMETLSKEK